MATAITQDFIVSSGLIVQGTAIVSTSTEAAGTLSVRGGAAVAKNINIGSTATIYGPSYLHSTINVDGASILSSTLYVGSNAGIQGTLNSTGTLSVSNSSSVQQFTVDTSGNVTAQGTGYFAGAVGVQGALNSTGSFSVNTTQFTVDSATGNVFSQGTGYFGGAVGVQGALNSTGSFSVNTTKFTVDAATGNAATQGMLYVQGTLGVNGSTVHTGTVTINDLTAADSVGATASLKTLGGEYIGKNLVVMSTASSNSVSTANAIYTPGGVGIDGRLDVGGDATFGGSVTFNGTATYVFSTNTFYTDNLIELHTPPTGVYGAWTLDDGKDIGFRFHYYNGQDLNAAIVLANDTKYFEFYKDGSETPLTGVFDSVDYATLKAGSLFLQNTTASNSPLTGALTVAGGVGISGKLYVAGGIDATVTTATNIAGGAQGYIPIQSATGATAFIPAGTQDNMLLTWSSTYNTATWVSASASIPNYARYAGTATNIGGGLANEIPYQSATSTTTFSSNLTFDGTYLTANSIKDSALTSGRVTYAGASGLLQDSANMTFNGTIFTATNVSPTNLTATRVTYYNGNTLVDSANMTFDGTYLTANSIKDSALTSGRVTYAGASGLLQDSANMTFNGTIFTAANVSPTNLTATRVTFYDGNTLVDDANLLYDSGTGTLSVGASDGNGNLYVGYNVQVDTSGSVTLSYATMSGVAWVNSSNDLVSDANLTYDGNGNLTASTSITSNGTITAANSVNVQGLGGNITMTGGSLTGVLNIDMSGYGNGTLTVGNSGAVTLLYATTNKLTYVNGSNSLVTDSNLSYNGTTLTLGGTTDTTGSADGALVVDGGVYVAKKVFINDNNNDTPADYLGAGALAVKGGIAVNNNVAIASTDATLAGTITTPSFGTQGGAYIAKDLYVGTTATIAGDLNVDGTIYVKGASLTGIDKITGSTGTFQDIVSTGTAHLGTVTATNTLYVGQTATFNSDVYIDGTLYVQGHSLTGVDQITGSTGTFQDIVSTGTIYANNITATNATFTGTVYVGGVNIKDALSASTGHFGDITAHNILATGTTTATSLIVTTSLDATTADTRLGATTATTVNVTSKLNVTGDSYLTGTTATSLNVTGDTTVTTLEASGKVHVTDTSDHSYGFGQGAGNSNWSIRTEGGISAKKNITAGGVVSAGDQTVTATGNDTGSVDAFYAVNNMQAARTIKAVTGTTKITIDVWNKTVYTTAKYLVQLVDTGVVHTEEIMLVQDGTNIYIAEYGIVYTSGLALGTFDADYSGSNVELTFTPAGATSMTIQVVRQSVLTAEEGFC